MISIAGRDLTSFILYSETSFRQRRHTQKDKTTLSSISSPRISLRRLGTEKA